MKRIYVAGPISAQNSEAGITEIVNFLRSKNLGEIIHPREKPIDHALDWRDREPEATELFKKNETFYRDSVDIMVADVRGPSVGRTLEQILAFKYGKPVIAYAPNPVHSPWPLVHTTVVVDTLEKIAEEIRKRL